MKAEEASDIELALFSNEKSKLDTEFGKISDGKVSLDIENGLLKMVCFMVLLRHRWLKWVALLMVW